jgi:hypothetical protein
MSKIGLLQNRDPKVLDVSALFLISSIFLACFMINTPVNGDTYLYANSLSTFEGPLIHLGYYALGYCLHSGLRLFGVTPLMTLGYLSVFFGSISAVSLYLFTAHLTKDRVQSLMASLVLLFSGTFWFFSEHGEVYVPQFGLVLLSLLLVFAKKPLLSSILFLIAVSITPTSCLAFPALAYFMWLERFEKRQVLWFVGPITLAFLTLVCWNLQFVVQTLEDVVISPKVFLKNFSHGDLIYKVIYDLVKVYGKAFNIFSLLALFAFFLLWKQDRRKWGSMLFIFLPFSLYLLNLGLFSGDHLIITFIGISFLGSYGLSYLFRITRSSLAPKIIITVILIGIHVINSYELFIRPEFRDSLELKRVVEGLGKRFEGDAIMLSDYNFGMAFWYFNNNEKEYFLLTGRPNKFLNDSRTYTEEQRNKLNDRFWIDVGHLPYLMGLPASEGLFEGRPVYFVDRVDWPTGTVRFLLSKEVLENRKIQIAKGKRVQKFLEERTGRKVEFTKLVDSPLYPVYFIRMVPEET